MRRAVSVRCRALPLAVAAAAVVCGSPIGRVAAQRFPDRPVRLVAPFAPGSERDVLASILARELAQSWREDVRIEHRPDGADAQGTAHVVRSYADGYTLLIGTPALVLRAAFRVATPFDVARDLLPITNVALMQLAVVTAPSVSADTLDQFLQTARARPGELALGVEQAMPVSRLAGVLLTRMAGIALRPVRVRAGMLPGELLGARVAVGVATVHPLLPHLQSGRLRAIAVTSARRATSLPEVPTVAEAGLPGYEATDWTGVFAPVRTPAAAIARLHADFAALAHLPEPRERMLRAGFEPVGSSQREFAEHLGADLRRWARLVSDSGIKPD